MKCGLSKKDYRYKALFLLGKFPSPFPSIDPIKLKIFSNCTPQKSCSPICKLAWNAGKRTLTYFKCI